VESRAWSWNKKRMFGNHEEEEEEEEEGRNGCFTQTLLSLCPSATLCVQ